MKILDNQVSLALIGFFSILAFWSALLDHAGISAFFAFLVFIQVIAQIGYKIISIMEGSNNNAVG